MGLAQGNLNQQGVAQGFGALQQQFAPGGGISKMFGGGGGDGLPINNAGTNMGGFGENAIGWS
jgi:hypothetical protein